MIDYQAVFHVMPAAVALLTPDLVYADANEAFLSMMGRTRTQVIGHYLFDVFPDNPHDHRHSPPQGHPQGRAATGMRNLEASLRRVAATGERDAMPVQRFEVEYPDRPGIWQERYWSPVNCAVFGPHRQVALLLQRVGLSEPTATHDAAHDATQDVHDVRGGGDLLRAGHGRILKAADELCGGSS